MFVRFLTELSKISQIYAKFGDLLLREIHVEIPAVAFKKKD